MFPCASNLKLSDSRRKRVQARSRAIWRLIAKTTANLCRGNQPPWSKPSVRSHSLATKRCIFFCTFWALERVSPSFGARGVGWPFTSAGSRVQSRGPCLAFFLVLVGLSLSSCLIITVCYYFIIQITPYTKTLWIIELVLVFFVHYFIKHAKLVIYDDTL